MGAPVLRQAAVPARRRSEDAGRRLFERRRALVLVGAALGGVVASACNSGNGGSMPAGHGGAVPKGAQPAGGASTTTGFSARFASFQPADEPNADPAKVVWPAFVTRAGPEVKALYEFQLMNGDLMRYMPCFCGCQQEDGHQNNRDCYIDTVHPDGSVTFDAMAPT